MESAMNAILGEMLEGAIDGVLSGGGMDGAIDGIVGGAISEFMNQLMPIIQQAAGIILLLLLPSLILGIVYCFFGLRTYRVLLVIDSVVNGGAVGGALLALIVLVNSGSAGGVLAGLGIGFVLFAIIFGLLAWFCTNVMLVIHSLFVGIVQVTGMFVLMRLNLIASIVLGVIFGIAFAVLIIIYKKWTIIGTHTYKGSLKIAAFLAVAIFAMSGNLKAMSVIYWICVLGFFAGGFYVQYASDKKNPVLLDGRRVNYMQQPVNYQQPMNSASYQQPMNSAPYQQPAAPVITCKLIGLEGMYKGFEFDVEKELVIGRDVDKCNIIFPEGTKGVSRIQCQLSINEQTGAVSVIDKFSSYGTSVNGVKLTQGVEMYLNTGDVIMFGENNVFKVQY